METGIADDWMKGLFANRRVFLSILVLCVATNATGLFVPILEPDGALYATIAKTIQQSGDYINLKVEGLDWLDKPHFPFWMAALSFEVLGTTAFAYKLPAFLFFLAGAVYTFLLAKKMYSDQVAKISVLFYLTAAHLVISNNDVRAEPYLTGLIIASVYHYYRSLTSRTLLHVVLGSLFAACAVMTKGPFALIIIGSGFFVDICLRRDWSSLFSYRWLCAILLIAVFILPELYSLYQQFDAHPEKTVFGLNHVSGIRFFFWDSQFGRFMNTGPIKGKGDLFFFLHTVLWAFLPWSLLLYAESVFAGRSTKSADNAGKNYIVIGSAAVSFLMFSLSRFQLPHYLNVIFPFFAIIAATYIAGIRSKKEAKIWVIVHNILFILLCLAPGLLALSYGMQGRYLIAAINIVLGLSIYLIYSSRDLFSSVLRLLLSSLLVYNFMNLFFYPSLFRYQSGLHAAAQANRELTSDTVFTYRENSYSFSFYTKRHIVYLQEATEIAERCQNGPVTVFTKTEELKSLQSAGLSTQVLGTYPHFHISALTAGFINPRTRKASLDYTCLIQVTSNPNVAEPQK